MKARPFVLCFEAHRADGKVWAVRQGRVWRLTKLVSVHVPLSTVYVGPAARQPKAYLCGTGVVRGNGRQLVIEAA